MTERDVLLEMLILESKGFLGISPRRIIELCSGWSEDSCDGDLEYRKYLEAYHNFLALNGKYVYDHVHDFGVIEMFKEVNDLMNNGYAYKEAVVRMIRNKLSLIKLPLAEPPYELLSSEYQENIKMNPYYMDIYMFQGKIEQGILTLEIIED